MPFDNFSRGRPIFFSKPNPKPEKQPPPLQETPKVSQPQVQAELSLSPFHSKPAQFLNNTGIFSNFLYDLFT